jgi:DNA repair exonuclease SbcCD ATPase subunit
MEEIDEYIETNRTFLENVKSGLRSISQEEQQLLLLRNQLNKIKKIREEQLKKDSLITSLKEKLAIYEHERSSSLRQNSELQEIMSERINTLERHLYEKENIEKLYIEKLEYIEEIKREKIELEEQLINERKS